MALGATDSEPRFSEVPSWFPTLLVPVSPKLRQGDLLDVRRSAQGEGTLSTRLVTIIGDLRRGRADSGRAGRISTGNQLWRELADSEKARGVNPRLLN
jgi:hypothetical protein